MADCFPDPVCARSSCSGGHLVFLARGSILALLTNAEPASFPLDSLLPYRLFLIALSHNTILFYPPDKSNASQREVWTKKKKKGKLWQAFTAAIIMAAVKAKKKNVVHSSNVTAAGVLLALVFHEAVKLADWQIFCHCPNGDITRQGVGDTSRKNAAQNPPSITHSRLVSNAYRVEHSRISWKGLHLITA